MADRHKSTSGVSAQQGAAENQQQPTGQTGHTPGPLDDLLCELRHRVSEKYVRAAIHFSFDQAQAWIAEIERLKVALATLEQICSAQSTIENAGYHDNYTDSAKARVRFAEGIKLGRAAIAKATGKAGGQ